MAKNSVVVRQKKREKLVQLKWDKRQEYKKIVLSLDSTYDEKLAAQAALGKMPKDSSPVRLKNRCQITGRGRGYLRKFKCSRLCFREMASFGLVPGVFKASW